MTAPLTQQTTRKPLDQVTNTKVDETVEYELNTAQCVKVALYMYQEWEKAMQPPLLIWRSFPDWLKQLENRGKQL